MGPRFQVPGPVLGPGYNVSVPDHKSSFQGPTFLACLFNVVRSNIKQDVIISLSLKLFIKSDFATNVKIE